MESAFVELVLSTSPTFVFPLLRSVHLMKLLKVNLLIKSQPQQSPFNQADRHVLKINPFLFKQENVYASLDLF